jgi:CRP-like cAMP-binding protein
MVEINIFSRDPNAIDLPAGSVIFTEGENGNLMYAVVAGVVELAHGGIVVEEVGPTGILGELALIDHSPRSATATAKTDARVVPVDEKRFMFLVQEHPTFALLVMRVMSDRIRKTNARSRGDQ